MLFTTSEPHLKTKGSAPFSELTSPNKTRGCFLLGVNSPKREKVVIPNLKDLHPKVSLLSQSDFLVLRPTISLSKQKMSGVQNYYPHWTPSNGGQDINFRMIGRWGNKLQIFKVFRRNRDSELPKL